MRNLAELMVEPRHMSMVHAVLQSHVPQTVVFAFGSRATGRARKTSDLDLCIKFDAPLGFAQLGAIKDAFSESNIPYKVDVVQWITLKPEFLASIEPDFIRIQ